MLAASDDKIVLGVHQFVKTYTRPQWYLVGISRKKVKKILTAMVQHGEAGEFLVRDAKEEPDKHELARFKMTVILQDRQVQTYLITKQLMDPKLLRVLSKNGKQSKVKKTRCGPFYAVFGTHLMFSSLDAMVNFYTTQKHDTLPLQLREPSFKQYAEDAMAMPDAENEDEALYALAAARDVEPNGDEAIYELASSLADPMYDVADKGDDEHIYDIGGGGLVDDNLYDNCFDGRPRSGPIYFMSGACAGEESVTSPVEDGEHIYGLATSRDSGIYAKPKNVDDD